MAPFHSKAPEHPDVHTHYVPLPYRDDGVAHALRAIYHVDSERLPPEMSALIARLDTRETNGPR